MADMEVAVNSVLQLNIRELDDDWVRKIWDSEFTELDSLPSNLAEDFEANNYHLQNLSQLKQVLKPWIEARQPNSREGFWTVLFEKDVSHKNLLALLYQLMVCGQQQINIVTFKNWLDMSNFLKSLNQRIANAVQVEAGILAADVYICLLVIPGSRAFKVFHSLLFQKAVDTFKSWHKLDVPTKRSRKSTSPVQRSQSGRRTRPRKRARESQPEIEEEDMDDEEDESADFTPHDIRKLHRAHMNLLKVLIFMLENYSLKNSDEATYHLVQVLVDLTKMEPEAFTGNFESINEDAKNMNNVPLLAYKGLSALCSESHGDVMTLVTAVFKHMLPIVLMLIGDNKGVAAQTIPRYVQTIKDNAITYVCHLIKTKPTTVLPVVRILLQHMCTKVPDRAEYRAKVAQGVVKVLMQMPTNAYARMIEWMYHCSRNLKVGYRVFGLEVYCLLLSETEKSDVPHDMPLVNQAFLSHRFLVENILARCSDIAASVRARAIIGFAECTSLTDPGIQRVIRDIVTPRPGSLASLDRLLPSPIHRTQPLPNRNAFQGMESLEPPVNVVRGEEQTSASGDANATPVFSAAGPDEDVTPVNQTPSELMTVQLTPDVDITLSDSKTVVNMLRQRSGDPKVNVRKAAIQALKDIIRMDGNDFRSQDLDVLQERCRDPSLLVRKQAIQCLTDLIDTLPSNKELQSAWLNGVLPMVVDTEKGGQDKSLKLLEEIIINKVVPYNRSQQSEHSVVWSMLDLLTKNDSEDSRRYLKKAFQLWGREGNLSSSLITSLKSHIGTENNNGAWMLLEEVAAYMPRFNTDFVMEYWNQYSQQDNDVDTQNIISVLSVLGHTAKQLKEEDAQQLTDNLKQRLMQFDSQPELITATVSTLNKVAQVISGDSDQAKRAADDWFAVLLTACDSYLSKVILDENQDKALDEDRIICHLFTLGEISQLCPSRTPKRVFMLVQSLVARPVITSVDGSSQELTSSTRSSSQCSNTSSVQPESSKRSSTGSDVASQRSSQGSEILSQFRSQAPGVLSQFRDPVMCSRIRAHALITLGKLCLQHDNIAEKCVPALARELEISTDPIIRNNVVIILCDLSIRYTAKVDKYIRNVSACLKDENLLVRRQTLILLTRLLQEDYLKWKESLFYRFIMTLVDDTKDIQDLSRVCLLHVLLKRHPGMFYNHFIECIFHFNCYGKHLVYNRFYQTDRERKLFSLEGKNNTEKRMVIYKFQLENMTDEHKFQLTAKLCQEVLGALADGAMPLDAETSSLLQDTLAVLSCKEMKLHCMKSKPHDDVVEEEDMAAAVMNVAKKTLITQVMKKNVMEHIVPTTISLKNLLERNRSPLTRELMLYLRELMKDYKNEVKEVLAANRQLASEIEFDMRKFEEQQQRELELQQESRGSTIGQITPTGSPRLRTPLSSPQNVRNASPRPMTPSAQRGTPRITTPRMATPRTATPKRTVPSSPAAFLGTPKMAPSVRKTQLSTMAVINSAKKAMEIAKKISSKENTPQVQKTRKMVQWSSPLSGTDSDTDSVQNVYKTPADGKRRPPHMTRAFSTPSANITLGNITFQQGDQNVSMAPPSPIMNIFQVLDTTNKPSWASQEDEEETGRQDVICMLSPEKLAPKARTWNVKALETKPNAMEEDSSNDESQDKSDIRGKPRRPTKTARRSARLANTSSELETEDSVDTSATGKKLRRATRLSGHEAAKQTDRQKDVSTTSGRRRRSDRGNRNSDESDMSISRNTRSNSGGRKR